MMQKSIETKITKLLDKIRPYIQMHGGDVSFEGFEKGVVKLHISGACAHCSLADLTYNNIIAGILMNHVPEVKEIKLIK